MIYSSFFFERESKCGTVGSVARERLKKLKTASLPRKDEALHLCHNRNRVGHCDRPNSRHPVQSPTRSFTPTDACLERNYYHHQPNGAAARSTQHLQCRLHPKTRKAEGGQSAMLHRRSRIIEMPTASSLQMRSSTTAVRLRRRALHPGQQRRDFERVPGGM